MVADACIINSLEKRYGAFGGWGIADIKMKVSLLYGNGVCVYVLYK